MPDQGNTVESEQPANWLRYPQANIIDGDGPDIQLVGPTLLDGQVMDVVTGDCDSVNAAGGPTLEHTLWYLYIGRDDHLLHREWTMSTFSNGMPQWRLDQVFSYIKVN